MRDYKWVYKFACITDIRYKTTGLFNFFGFISNFLKIYIYTFIYIFYFYIFIFLLIFIINYLIINY